MGSKLDKMTPLLYQYWDGVVRGTSGHTIRAEALSTGVLKAAKLTFTTLTVSARIAARCGLPRVSGIRWPGEPWHNASANTAKDGGRPMNNDDKEEWHEILTEAAVALGASAVIFILICLVIWLTL